MCDYKKPLLVFYCAKCGKPYNTIALTKPYVWTSNEIYEAIKRNERLEIVYSEHNPLHSDYCDCADDETSNDSFVNPDEFDLRLNRLLKEFEALPKNDIVNCLSFYLNVALSK